MGLLNGHAIEAGRYALACDRDKGGAQESLGAAGAVA